MTSPILVFRVHAVKRMFERGITEDEVHSVAVAGATIESYPNDFPFPSRLVLGWSRNRPLHVVVATNQAQDQMIVITVYEPSDSEWENNFTVRK